MLLQCDAITFLFSLENLAASALKSNCPKLFLVCLKIFLLCTEVAGMSRECSYVFLFNSYHFQKTHNIIKFGTNYCIFAPVGRWTNPPLRDHPSVPIWWGISLITGLWSPESRLSFARTTVTFTRTPGPLEWLSRRPYIVPNGFMAYSEQIQCQAWPFPIPFVLQVRMMWTSVLAGWCISWWATSNPRSQTMPSVFINNSINVTTVTE